jgi:hypothetical protein
MKVEFKKHSALSIQHSALFLSWGRGIEKITDACIAAGLPKPIIEENSGGIAIELMKTNLETRVKTPEAILVALKEDESLREEFYGRKTIDFSLLYCDRKTMEIAVHPDSTVIVKAPVQSDITLIEKKIIKQARWILKALNYFKLFNPKTPDRCYVNGETHLYLGKQYRLKLAEGTENSVKLSRGFFHITCRNEPTPSATKKQKRLQMVRLLGS